MCATVVEDTGVGVNYCLFIVAFMCYKKFIPQTHEQKLFSGKARALSPRPATAVVPLVCVCARFGGCRLVNFLRQVSYQLNSTP